MTTAGLCSDDLGTLPVLPQPNHDGSQPVQVSSETASETHSTVWQSMPWVSLAETFSSRIALCLPPAHASGAVLQIVDRTFSLPAGAVDSWTLYNYGAAAPITLQV
eukprot:SAG11_NODE_38_length_21705_cov_24.667453_4_plen_106_part_00